MLMFSFFSLLAQTDVETDPIKVIGGIATPTPNTVLEEVPRIGAGDGNPLYGFISWGLTLITIAVGIYAVVNLVLAGAQFIMGAGDAASMEKIRKHVTNTLLGLGIIVLAYAVTAIVSTIIFGDPLYYINPQIPQIK